MPRRCCSSLLRSRSSHMQSLARPPQISLSASKGIILPRPPYARNPSRSFHIGSASSGVAARYTVKSRGRILRRSTLIQPTGITASFSSLYSGYTFQQRAFSSSPVAMTATKIDGTAIAKKIRERLHSEIVTQQKTNPRYKPSLKIIQGNLCSSTLWSTITNE
jgi:hypothetical protein